MNEPRTNLPASGEPDASTLRIQVLNERECRAFLGSCTIGRLAFLHRNRVDIEPISVALDGDWLFGRTSAGTKLSMLRHHPWVAVEVDRIDAEDDWASVVVHGTFHEIGRAHSRGAPDLHERALTAVRRVSPHAFTNDDPAPWRSALFGISIDSLAGRRAVPRGAGTQG